MILNFVRCRFLWLLPALAAAGCATRTTPQVEGKDATATLESAEAEAIDDSVAIAKTARRVMVKDMSSIITQLYDPITTTFQVSEQLQDNLSNQMNRELAVAGYGIQRVVADQGANFVRTSLRASDVENIRTMRVRLGSVVINRDYEIDGETVIPRSPYRIGGTLDEVVVDTSTLANKLIEDESAASVERIAHLDLDEPTPVISLVTPDVVNRIADENTAKASPLQELDTDSAEVPNLFYSNKRSFGSILDELEQVHSQVIVFGNDSMALGNTNKQLIDALVNDIMQPDDFISLVGCSNGPTALKIGNEGLAIGRAQRVTEALVARGVPRDNIYNEGCWAPVSAGERFPGRGVVIELWRDPA
ncbi:MAG: hypothetical protein CSB44_04285 [Gammaproteobacteria bacterium]|nr:MAG: hypothetical protein CSB44_04285 [Gammaproteobacteria bacterium]